LFPNSISLGELSPNSPIIDVTAVI
jgi:hypothetical protein